MSKWALRARKATPSAARARSGRRIATLLACWAVVLPILFPLAPMPLAPKDAAGAPSWMLGSLCHAELATVDAASDGKAAPGSQAPLGDQPVCPVCLGLHLIGAFTPPALTALPLPRAIVAAPGLAFDLAVPEGRRHSAAAARAPPAIA